MTSLIRVIVKVEHLSDSRKHLKVTHGITLGKLWNIKVMDKRVNFQGMLSFDPIQWMTGSYGKEFRLPCGKFEHHKIGGEGYYDALSKN